jgi:hypothetical protein
LSGAILRCATGPHTKIPKKRKGSVSYGAVILRDILPLPGIRSGVKHVPSNHQSKWRPRSFFFLVTKGGCRGNAELMTNWPAPFAKTPIDFLLPVNCCQVRHDRFTFTVNVSRSR